jgi:hypothetical protein
MTSLPYPFFVNETPVDTDNNRSALSAVGRCRVSPETCTASNEDYRAIFFKNKEQAHVDVATPETEDENKKLKKKYMKQGVAMASTYLNDKLQLDVSIIDVEVVVDPKDIVETDGCLTSCLLDAGCARIVVDGTHVDAMDAAKLPRERVVAHFNESNATAENIQSALPLAGTISVELTHAVLETVERILSLVPGKRDMVVFQLASIKGITDDDLTKMVGQMSRLCKDGKGAISLVDPSANQLGLSYAACMKTDRQDGLYTTVVCTRSGEALGLVYSSKVSEIL